MYRLVHNRSYFLDKSFDHLIFGVETGEGRENVMEIQLQHKLVIPQENSDEHPLMQKYAKISETALKNYPPELESEFEELPTTG